MLLLITALITCKFSEETEKLPLILSKRFIYVMWIRLEASKRAICYTHRIPLFRADDVSRSILLLVIKYYICRIHLVHAMLCIYKWLMDTRKRCKDLTKCMWSQLLYKQLTIIVVKIYVTVNRFLPKLTNYVMRMTLKKFAITHIFMTLEIKRWPNEA